LWGSRWGLREQHAVRQARTAAHQGIWSSSNALWASQRCDPWEGTRCCGSHEAGTHLAVICHLALMASARVERGGGARRWHGRADTRCMLAYMWCLSNFISPCLRQRMSTLLARSRLQRCAPEPMQSRVHSLCLSAPVARQPVGGERQARCDVDMWTIPRGRNT
jgi:hypothetical protein